MNMWLGYSEKKLTAPQRRILITHWVGEAHERLQSPHYEGFIRNCFEKTGCLITADGSEDEKIKPEGLIGYPVFEPLDTVGPNEPEIVAPQPANSPDDIVTSDDIFTSEDNENESENLDSIDDLIAEETSEPEQDDESDRLYNVELVGKKICAEYESGWHTGTIRYYNSKTKKYLLSFEDDSTDLIEEKDIDGVEMYIADQGPRRAKRVDYKALAKGN